MEVIRILISNCFCFVVAGIFLSSCQTTDKGPSVVIYTSIDQVYSEPILKKFEKATGVRVLPVYDVEAAKTTGLVNRLLAEKDRPQADVFWNGEFAQTILLKKEGVLAPYRSPNAADIPATYVDSEGYWSGFAGRARVLLINTTLISPSAYPQSIFDLLNTTHPADKIGIAYPLFGTAATHAAAIYAALGPDAGRDFFKKLQARGIRVVDGNSVVRDLVASGQLIFGLTDTDDACSAVRKGAPVKTIFPDQGKNGLGTLIVPNTVSLIAKAPHPQEARKLIDFLLSKETEEALIRSGWSHIALRPVGVQPGCFENSSVKGMNMNLYDIYGQLSVVKRELAEIFIR
ncbi:MAG: ABC transporter substrate-binding protein [Candidatus Aminicenantes bacterium RBG_19FT_COMBO_58_17]|nr:MAG: ABC transporter substrate-binding protein [Candidatus Aminicenantes bacterium RBG_19FT_COMBO_58_17]